MKRTDENVNDKDNVNNIDNNEEVKKKEFHFKRTAPDYKMKKKDFIILLVITLVYGVIALWRLGDMAAPQTELKVNDTPYVLLDLGEARDIGAVHYFTGQYAYYHVNVSASDEQNKFGEEYASFEENTVFAWEHVNINAKHRYIRVTFNDYRASFKEMVVTDKDGNIITPVNADSYPELFDEQKLYPQVDTFMDETIFDEIYHARTAYEFIHGLTTYETTHPPLGKIFISLGIRAFGMNPFGWRIVGTIFGILMIPVIYLFAKKMFEKTWMCTVVCLLFTFDFMHFAQTRISTIDVYITFFIMLMYYFMYKYVRMSFYDSKFSKTLIPLALSGVSMGLGVAGKWTGCYAGVGLGVIFFYHMGVRFKEYLYAKKHPGGETDGIEHDFVIKHFTPYCVKTLLWCVLFFVIVPGIIYVLSYIPFVSYSGETNLIKKMLENQEYMFTYHTGLEATHAYSSHWYQWPTMVRPLLFYSQCISETVRQGISTFGNPAVWWAGILATSFVLYHAIANSDKKAWFLLTGYAAQFVPWMLVPRYTFIYHYFPSTPFVVMVIGYSIYKIYHMQKTDVSKRRVMIAAIIYCAIAVGLFIMFYPVLSGLSVPGDYVETFLRWFDTWVLVY